MIERPAPLKYYYEESGTRNHVLGYEHVLDMNGSKMTGFALPAEEGF
jgi:hypothetical protein